MFGLARKYFIGAIIVAGAFVMEPFHVLKTIHRLSHVQLVLACILLRELEATYHNLYTVAKPLITLSTKIKLHQRLLKGNPNQNQHTI